jgi:ATP-dependent DNA helicase DinG
MNETALKEPLSPAISASALERATAEALSGHGPLAEHDASFIERNAQQAMAEAVAQAIDRREPLVAEAGTGVGKTFAYLVPLLLSGRRALVSTATKALQDQLFLRDLPRLLLALKLPARLALLKGRRATCACTA